MGRFLYFLIMLLLARMLVRGILSFAAASRRQVGATGPPPPPTPGEPVHKGVMVRDPVCGIHVPQSRALTAPGDDGDTVYFCSDRCRSAYAARS